jgi:hypothetical protein
MAEADFEFVPGPRPSTVRIVFRGFWDEAVVQRYRQALRERAIQRGASAPVGRVLLDFRDCETQSQAVIDAMAQILVDYAHDVEGYGVVLPGSTLFKLQTKRLMTPTGAAIFEDEEKAAAWLSS